MAKVAVLVVLVALGCFDGSSAKNVRASRDIQRDIPDASSPKSTQKSQEPVQIEDIHKSDNEELSNDENQPKIENSEKKNWIDPNYNISDNQFPQAKVLYTGCQLWKTVVDSENKIQVLAKLREENEITMWGGNLSAVDILVRPDAVDKVKQVLKEMNINYDVAIEDLQKAIDEENPSLDEEDFENRNGHRLTWQAYHRFQDINGFLEFLAETYQDIATVHTIGNSVGGLPIKLLKISNKRSGNRAVWVDGGIHAREWISPAAVTYIINQFTSNWENEPKYIQNIDWYFAPLLNPDGYEYTHVADRLWRKNRRGSGRCAGIDLNRNFGYRWGGTGSSKNPCAETYGGPGPFSEPETVAVQRFISGANAKWKAYVSFHSYGQYILFPWGYNRVVPPDYQDLQQVGNRAAQAIRNSGGPAYTVGPAANTLYPAAGGSDDWAKGTMKMKYAYTIELRDNGRYGFILPASYIQPTAKEALAALRVIAEAASKV